MGETIGNLYKRECSSQTALPFVITQQCLCWSKTVVSYFNFDYDFVEFAPHWSSSDFSVDAERFGTHFISKTLRQQTAPPQELCVDRHNHCTQRHQYRANRW